MADNELHYLTYDPERMWEDMILAYVEAGGDVLYPGDEKETLLRGVQMILVQAYAAFDHAARMRTLRYALGEYLDLIGETRGVLRMEAVEATAEMDVTVRGAVGTYTLAAGTLFTFDGSNYYEVAEDVSALSDGNPVTLRCRILCTETGASGNGLPSGTQMTPVQGDHSISTAVLVNATSGGLEAEDDDDYRSRIRESGYINTTGPREAYRAEARGVSSAIRDANAITGTPGEVIVALLFEEGTTQDIKTTLKTAVATALSADEKRPLTDRVRVEEAGQVSYTLNVSYTIPANAPSDVGTAVTNAAAQFKNEQEGLIGIPFDPYRLLSLLYSAGATRVEFLSGSVIAGQPIAYTAIDGNKALKGTINLTAAT